MRPVLTTGGVYFPYKGLDYKQIEKIKELFTIEYVGYKHSISIARAYKEYPKQKTLCIPKFGLFDLLEENDYDKLRPFRKIGFDTEEWDIAMRPRIKTTKNPKISWTGRLKSYQTLITDYIMEEYFYDDMRLSGQAGVILKLPTGHGKTFVAMALMSILQTPTLIVCPRCSIAKQWIILLKKMFPEITIGSYFTGSKVYSETIMVSVIDSLASTKTYLFKEKRKRKKKNEKKGELIKEGREFSSKQFFEMWNLTIFDECHNYCTTRKDIYRRIASNYTLGLSATPNQKKTGFGIIPLWNIGPILDVTEDIEDYMKQYTTGVDSVVFKGIVHNIRYNGPPKYTINYKDEDGVMDYRKMMTQLREDPYRTQLILKTITELSSRHKCILVYSEWIEPINLIIAEFKKKDKENSENGIFTSKQVVMDKKIFDVITGGAKDPKVLEAFNNANIIYTTYKYFGEGISVPRISAILYTNPRRTNTEQYNGRLIRPSNDHDVNIKTEQNEHLREIVDIADWKVGLKNSYFARLKEYRKLMKGNELGTEFVIIKKDVDWDKIESFKL